MPDTDTGERVTPVLDFPSRDGLVVQRRPRRLRAGRVTRVLTVTRPARTCT